MGRKYVIVASTRDFDVHVCHSDVLGIDFQVIRGSHDDEFDGSLVSERFIGPTRGCQRVLLGSQEQRGEQTIFLLSGSL
jgi:hypothetical protein